jgi:hypothetical protein
MFRGVSYKYSILKRVGYSWVAANAEKLNVVIYDVLTGEKVYQHDHPVNYSVASLTNDLLVMVTPGELSVWR